MDLPEVESFISFNENNIDELKQVKNIDGFLLGGISLKLSSLQEFLDKLQ